MAVIANFGVPVSGGGDATLMPKLQYRFRVKFTNLGNANNGALVTKNVISVTRPALDHEDVTIDVYNSKIRLAGKHTWQDITLVIRDDVNSDVITQLGNQISAQVNHAGQSSQKSGSSYKFGMTIETLDGAHDEGDAGVLDSWDIAGAFIPSIQYGDLNYSSSEFVQCTITIRYDNAAHNINAADVLSGSTITAGAGDSSAVTTTT